MFSKLSRRGFLGSLALAGAAPVLSAKAQDSTSPAAPAAPAHAGHGGSYGSQQYDGANLVVGSVDHARNEFDPLKIATDFDMGKLVTDPNGRTVREWEVVGVDKEVEIAPGVMFPAWTFNGRIPGPTFRCTEGERLRIRFFNGSSHPHSMHFHGIHSWRVDGVPGAGLVQSGEVFEYEFEARPFGCHLYHCHALPLKRHIHKGMYGTFIIDPDPARHPEAADVARSRLYGTPENRRWQEFVMVMNGFDTNFDDENEFYTVNAIPFAYVERPIRIERSRPVRLYLVNVTEFDPINSLHLHANFFDYYDHGTTLTPTLKTIDTVMQCQGQRGILEFTYAEHEPGLYMFHAHQSEFAELGWMSHFEVVDATAAG
jgi:FtsP/CotA-like multicopper oxidase with cupredoxin domain